VKLQNEGESVREVMGGLLGVILPATGGFSLADRQHYLCKPNCWILLKS